MSLPNIFQNARLKAELIEQQNWNSELASYVQDLEAALQSKNKEYLQACSDNVEFGIQYCDLETKYQDLHKAYEELCKFHDARQRKCNVFEKDIEGLCQDIDTMQEQIEELHQDIDIKDQQIEDLLMENHQFGLDARVRVHELERDLETAKQVAEYWKASAEAQQILTSIYKTLSSL